MPYAPVPSRSDELRALDARLRNIEAGRVTNAVIADLQDQLAVLRSAPPAPPPADGGVTVAPGTMQIFAGNASATPAGFVVCDGTLYQIVDQQALYAAIGTLHGGDGVTTFAVPNLKGRVVVGVNANDIDFNQSGNSGGAKTTTIGGHTHGLSSGWGNFSIAGSVSYFMRKAVTAFTPSYNQTGAAWSSAGNTSQSFGMVLGGTTDAAGGTTVPVVQPFVALIYIIKT